MEETNIHNNISKKNKLPLLLICLLILSIAANIFLLINSHKNQDYISGNSFRLIKPLENVPIDSDIQDGKVILHYNGLKSIIEQDIKEYNMTGNASVFIQDVRTGGWLGIDEKKEFVPASLLKIPIMMAILKKVERGEIKLDDNVTLIQEDLDSLYGTLYQKGAGTKISVEELLKEMILSSDNTAKNALKRYLSPEEINAVFVHVGIPNPYTQNNVQINGVLVSPRDYTRFFKSLYYSTFLSPELSEKALDLATDTEEENLISKGVPSEIQVSHKFGVYYNELQDCGIVYHPKNPYFLCIMTSNVGSQENNGKLISKISKDTFEFVDTKSN